MMFPFMLRTKRQQVAFFAGLLLWCGLVLSLLQQDHALGSAAAREVIVRDGDTLWSIATQHNLPNRDVRDLVAALRELNHLDGRALQVGETVLVPDRW